MAKVKSFTVHDTRGVPDGAIAAFITECEVEHYVTVTMLFIPVPTPRVTVIVTKLDEKNADEIESVEDAVVITPKPEPRRVKHRDPIPRCTNSVP